MGLGLGSRRAHEAPPPSAEVGLEVAHEVGGRSLEVAPRHEACAPRLQWRTRWCFAYDAYPYPKGTAAERVGTVGKAPSS